jgi:hypothetical protein
LNLLNDLKDVILEWSASVWEDKWSWKVDEIGVFLVKSANMLLEQSLDVDVTLSWLKEGVFESIWKSPAPSKVMAFSWKLLHYRIPMKDNLSMIYCFPLEANLFCEFCGNSAETCFHLFLHCQVVFELWSKVLGWLEMNFITPQNLFLHFECWDGEVKHKKLRKGCRLIWHATLWVIWNSRNNKFFNNITKEIDDMVEEVKVLSWQWSLSLFDG